MLDNKNGDQGDASSSEVEVEDSKYVREASPPHVDTLADNPDIAVSHRRVERVVNRVKRDQVFVDIG
jgi:hypothetical protein